MSCPIKPCVWTPNSASGVLVVHMMRPAAVTPSISRRSFRYCSWLLRCTLNAHVCLLSALSDSSARPPTVAA